MARDLFIDLTNNRLAASETNLAPAGNISFVKGDTGTWNLYFLEATGAINRPFEVVDKSAASVKMGIGSRALTPESGTYTLTFGGDTTASIAAAATAGAIQTALNNLAAITAAGGVTVTGTLEEHFTVRFGDNGARALISADVSQLIPDTVAVIDERIAGTASVKEVQEIQLRLTPAVYQPTWTDLSTTVTATISTTVTGTDLLNEVQRLSFTQKPFSGTFSLTFPSSTITINSAVSGGLFIADTNHGLSLNQPVAISGFDSGVPEFVDRILYVESIPDPKQFKLSLIKEGNPVPFIESVITDPGFITTTTRQSAPIAANASTASVQAALQAMDSIGADNILVSGIVGQYYDLTFSGTKGYANQPQFTVQNNTTAKPGKTANVDFATFALRDLLGNDPSVDLDLEIEITESGARSTVVLGGCTVSEELIDADSFSPTVGYPSYIFQALTAAATNATTSLVAITGLNWTAQANSEYLVEWNLLVNDVGQGDFDGEVSVPTGASIYGKWIICDKDNGLYGTSGENFTNRERFASLFDEEGFSNQKAYIKTGSTAGTVSFQFAKDIAGITGTANEIMTGSWVRVEKVV